jgi:DNA-binding response OmpR family regulator
LAALINRLVSMANLLIVDDEVSLTKMVAGYLRTAGHQVDTAQGGEGMRRRLDAGELDLIVLDRYMPGEDGLTLLSHLRATTDLGVLMLTGAAGLDDRLAGLDGGADDYLTKPFSPRELLARVEAIIRRRRWKDARTAPFGPFTLDLKAWRLLKPDGSDVGLVATEVDLVAAFASHPNKVLNRDDILRLAPARGDDPLDRSVDTRLGRLRFKLAEAGLSNDLVRTVRGSGYIYTM